MVQGCVAKKTTLPALNFAAFQEGNLYLCGPGGNVPPQVHLWGPQECQKLEDHPTLRIRKGCQPGCQNHGAFEALFGVSLGGSGVSIGGGDGFLGRLVNRCK